MKKTTRTNDKRTFLKHNTCPTWCSNIFSHTLHIRVMHVSHIYGYIRVTCVSYTCMYMLKLRFKYVWPAVHICLTRKRPYRRGSIDGSLETRETVRVSAESYPWSMLRGVFSTNFRTISAWETNKPNGWIPNTSAKNMLAKTRRRIQQQVIVMVGTGNLEFCTSNNYCAHSHADRETQAPLQKWPWTTTAPKWINFGYWISIDQLSDAVWPNAPPRIGAPCFHEFRTMNRKLVRSAEPLLILLSPCFHSVVFWFENWSSHGLLLRAPLVSLCHLQDHQETIASQRCWSHAPMAPPSERNHKKKAADVTSSQRCDLGRLERKDLKTAIVRKYFGIQGLKLSRAHNFT